MGVLDKNILQFDTVFWDKDVDFFYLLNNGSSRYELSEYLEVFNIQYYENTSNILCIFESGLAGVQIESYSDQTRLDNIMAQLRTVWPDAPYPTKYYLTNWMNDPYTYGGYSSYGVDSSPDDRSTFTKPIDSTVYFAGEHTSTCYFATTGGAYYSGVDAAYSVMGKTVKNRCHNYSSDTKLSTAWIIGITLIALFVISCLVFTVVYLRVYLNRNEVDQAIKNKVDA
jgi:monoamine oxidase